jgi:hypothetical protein
MNKKTAGCLLFLFLLMPTIVSYGQTYFQNKNIPKPQIVPDIPYGMTYEEFEMLNREMNWKQLLIGMVVPGYLHFYADRPGWGWSIAGTRALGFGLMMWGIIDQWKYFGTLNWSEDYIKGDEARAERNIYLFMSGLAVNIFAYGLDWAHADIVIENDRNSVMYKYGIKHWKVEPTSFNTPKEVLPGICLSINF